MEQIQVVEHAQVQKQRMAQHIQSIERAAQVLEALAEDGGLMGVTEIAGRVNLGKSTVHRILASLTRVRFVRMDPESHQYTLGYGLLQLTSGVLRGSEVSMIALPHLRDLRQKTRETVTLNLRDNNHRVVVERLDTSHEIRYVAEIGWPLPLHVGAGGKAILAFMDAIEVHGLLEEAELSTRQIRKLNRELKEIRSAGTAYTLGERLPGAGSISAPVFDHEGAAIASVNVLSLEARLNVATVRKFRRLVRTVGLAVSRELGWQPMQTRQRRVNE